MINDSSPTHRERHASTHQHCARGRLQLAAGPYHDPKAACAVARLHGPSMHGARRVAADTHARTHARTHGRIQSKRERQTRTALRTRTPTHHAAPTRRSPGATPVPSLPVPSLPVPRRPVPRRPPPDGGRMPLPGRAPYPDRLLGRMVTARRGLALAAAAHWRCYWSSHACKSSFPATRRCQPTRHVCKSRVLAQRPSRVLKLGWTTCKIYSGERSQINSGPLAVIA